MPIDPPFRTVSIVGLGLIGGSIALAIRERWTEVRITGVDRRAVLAHAVGSGAIERAVDSAADAAAVDLLILAAPIRQNLKLLAEVVQRLPSTTVVTDVGSTKRDIVNQAVSLGCAASFVGGHPICGAAHARYALARPDLVRHRPRIYPPTADAAPAAVERLFDFARGVGARPSTLDPDEHDRLMAFVSHLPQLTASSLMDVIGGSVKAEGLRLAGRGLVDTTRLASSPVETWRDVCATNEDSVAAALDLLIARLSDLRADLRKGDAIDRIFADAAKWRSELMKERD